MVVEVSQYLEERLWSTYEARNLRRISRGPSRHRATSDFGYDYLGWYPLTATLSLWAQVRLSSRMRVASLQNARKLSLSAARIDCLAGTVPLHQAYILLLGRDSPRSFPSRLTSPLLVALRQYALRWSALVNVAWVPPSNSNRHLSIPPSGSQDPEVYNLLTFAHGRAGLHIPSVTMDNLDEVCSRLDGYMERPPTGAVDSDDLYLYVCTHGARDCRCGEWGSKVADALRNEIRQRKEKEPTGKYSRVVVGEVGHIGGHQ